jgi:DNA-directed RNA polymerase subunit RPC12/RpoP
VAPSRPGVSEVVEFACGSCGSQIQVEAHLRTATCPYCASPAVVERPREAGRPQPDFVLAFIVPHEQALTAARRWVRRAWLAPEAFRTATVEAIRGIYVPSYLFSAAAHAEYTARIGENYTVTYTTTDSKGRTVTRTRTETEWHTLTGSYSAYVSDVVVTASRGIDNHELEGVEPFDLRALHRYSPRLLSGWIAEEASMTAEVCRELAVAEAMAEVQRRVMTMMPGDRQSDLQVSARLADIAQILMLAPVWVLPVRFADDRVVRLLVNGQTGKVFGKPPRSWAKIGALIVLMFGLIVGGVLLAQR